MNNLEKIIKEYLPEITDVNQNKTVEILPLTIVDMMLEYHESEVKKLGLSDVRLSVCTFHDLCDSKRDSACIDNDDSCKYHKWANEA